MVGKSLGSRHTGLGEWLWQRASAVYMVFFIPAMVIYFLLNPVTGYEDWLGRFGSFWMRAGWLLFCFLVLAHAWIGFRSVLMDYVHSLALRNSLYFLLLISLLGQALWLLDMILGVAR